MFLYEYLPKKNNAQSPKECNFLILPSIASSEIVRNFINYIGKLQDSLMIKHRYRFNRKTYNIIIALSKKSRKSTYKQEKSCQNLIV